MRKFTPEYEPPQALPSTPACGISIFRSMARRSLLLAAMISSCAAAIPKLHAQAGAVQFSAPVFDVVAPSSGTVPGTITVTRSGGSSGVVSVQYCVYASGKGDTAQGLLYTSTSGTYVYKDFVSISTQGVDNVAAEGTLTWADGDTASKTITITVNARAAVEGDVWLSAILASPEGGVAIGSQQFSKVRIVEPNAPVFGVLQMSSMNYFVKENGGSIAVTVRRSGGGTGAVSVSYSTSATAPVAPIQPSWAQAGGGGYPAAPANNFTAVSGTLSWTAGDVADKTITIPIADNTFVDGARAFMVNLSSSTGGAALGFPSSAPVFIIDDESSVVDVRNFQNGKASRIWFPSDAPTLKGFFVYLPGSSGDTRSSVTNVDWQTMVRNWGFCLLGQNGNGFGAYSMSDILDRAVLSAAFSGHPELANAPFVITGFSAGSYDCMQATRLLPERMICFAGFNYGSSMSATPTTLQKTVPGIMVVGSLDSLTPYFIKTIFDSYRSKGYLTAIAENWRVAHSDADGSARLFTWHYISEIISLRYPAGLAPGVNPGQIVPLNNLQENSGWLGDPLETNYPTNQLISYSTPFVYVNGYDDYVSPRGFAKAAACWLPSKASAMSFRAQVSFCASTYTSGQIEPFQTPLKFTTPAEYQRFNAGENVSVTVDPRNLVSGYGSIAKMEFYDQGVKIAEVTSAPWTCTIPSPSVGTHGLTTIAVTTTGTQVTGLTLYTVGPAVIPSAPTGFSAAPSSGATVDLWWADTSYSENGFRLERKSGVNGTFALLANLPANTITFSDTGLTAGIQYYYRITAYNGVGDSAFSTATANTAAAMTGPVGFWNFDENTGTTVSDSSGNANTGTFKGSPAFSTDCKPAGGSAVSFNGTDAYVSCVSGTSLHMSDAMSIMGWFNHSSVGGDGTVGLDAGSYRLTVLGANAAASQWQFYFTDPTGTAHSIQTTGTFTNDAWHHVCGTFNGSVMNLYIDGTLQATANWAGQIKANTYFNIGRRDSNRFYKGKIDTVKLYNRAINATEVTAEYNSGLNGPPIISTAGPLPNGTVDAAYNQTLMASGGTAPYTWVISSGSLPPGLSLSSGGVLSGTPSAAGATSFTLKVTGSDGLFTTQSFSLTVLLSAPQITSEGTASGTRGVGFTYQIAATGSPTSYGASGLPPGLVVSTETGLISGTPSVIGTSSATITATNAGGTASALLTIVVRTPYGTWQNRWFTELDLADPAIGGDAADPAGDGIPNLVKYALNLEPDVIGVHGLPVVFTEPTDGEYYLTMSYTQVVSATDIAYIPEVSANLQNWYSDSSSIVQVRVIDNLDGATQTVIVRDLTAARSVPRHFIRLRVTRR